MPELFYITSGLFAEGEEKQLSALLYCMGEDAEDTLQPTRIMPDERKQYQAVVDIFDGFLRHNGM